MIAQPREDPVAALAYLGTFWAGDTGPSILITLINQNGGLAQLAPTGVAPIVVDVVVRRWDSRRQMSLGAVVTEGYATVLNQQTNLGQCQFFWTQATLGTLPRDTGWYVLQADLTWPNGEDFGSQRALLQVLPSTRTQPL